MNRFIKPGFSLLFIPLLVSCGSGEDAFSNVPVGEPTGIADQDSFSIATSNLSPEALNINGIEVTITATASDRNNYPIPDGSVIHFKTSGGTIENACKVAKGTCTVTWTSGDPRPATGIANILAYTTGEESYLDANGDDIYDAGDTLTTDLGEAYLDNNNNGNFDQGVDELVDLNGNFTYDGPNGLYDGESCNNTNCGGSRVHVRNWLNIVMSGSNGFISNLSLANNSNVTAGNTDTITFNLTDANGNVMPTGTTLSISAANATLNGSYAFDTYNTGYSLSVTWGSAGAATITIVAETPGTDTYAGTTTTFNLSYTVN